MELSKEKQEAFGQALQDLQKEHDIAIRPFIAPYGPDIQLVPLVSVEKAEEMTKAMIDTKGEKEEKKEGEEK